MATRSLLMRRGFVLYAALALLVRCGYLPAQQTPSPAAPASQPEIRLEAHDGKSQFFLGERLQLDLVFRNATSEKYTLNSTLYREIVDEVELFPASGWSLWRKPFGHDYATAIDLGAKEVRVPIVLNQNYLFHSPGRYQIRLTTRRLSHGPDIAHLEVYGPVTTNTVTFELKAMPPEVETKLVQEAREAIGPASASCCRNQEREEAIARLADLQGDEALRAKVDLILADDQQIRLYLEEAIASTRNVSLLCSLLEKAWSDPRQTPVYGLLNLLAEARALARGMSYPEAASVANSSGGEPETRSVEDERVADMKVLLDSLPQRKGENRAATLVYLLEFAGFNQPDRDEVRSIAISEFSTFSVLQQDLLLEIDWNRLRGSDMVEPLRTLLQRSPRDEDALRRLIELAPEETRSGAVSLICSKDKPISVQSVAGLPFETLPEVDGCLGELLALPPSKPNDWDWQERAALAVRFATAAILPDVRAGWKYPEQDQEVLPLFIHWAPEEAMTVIAGKPFDSGRLLDIFIKIDQDLTTRHAVFPSPVLDWLRQILEAGPDGQAGFAAFELSQCGEKQDRALIEARLARLRKEWPGRQMEIEAENESQAAQNARTLESDLVSALSAKRFAP